MAVATDAGALAAILAAFGGGTVVAAQLTSWHDRTERFRERMIAAADSALVALHTDRVAISALRVAAHEALRCGADLEAAQTTMPVVRADAPTPLVEAQRAIAEVFEAQQIPFSRSGDLTLGGMEALLVRTVEARRNLLAFTGPPESQAVVAAQRQVLIGAAAVTRANSYLAAAENTWRQADADARGRLGRLTLLFAGTKTVGEAAEQATHHVRATRDGIWTALAENRDPLADPSVDQSLRAAGDATTAFALAANQATRKPRI